MSARLSVRVRILAHGRELPLPRWQTVGAAGADLHAAVSESVLLLPGERKLVPCGFALALPPGWEAQVRPRSGLAIKHGVTVLNSPGTIDADYRGEVQVILVNLGTEPFTIQRGDRIAQLVLSPVTVGEWEVVASLEESARGAGGFGSTGR